ncbi:MAG: preprotein translocase subunit SecY [Actinomycetota bacterium]|nr:preprotein translocase subunit SecY [Actinomycetota bacterium]
MIEALANAFRVPELRRRILFTLLIIGVYRLGAHIPVPGVDVAAIQGIIEGTASLDLLNLFSGGGLERFAVFSLGIMPYITATIIMQLLQGVIPKIEQWYKEGESGQRKITQASRYLTLGIALLESIGLLTVFRSTIGGSGFNLVTNAVIVITLIAGTALIMWMGELITQRGIGNGMSLLIFASIVARFPVAIYQSLRLGNFGMVIAMMLIFVFVIAAIIYMERGQRRIPVQYAKRVVGRKVYGGSGTYIPLKVNGAGVIPIIFASALLFFPAQLAQLTNNVTIGRIGTAMSSGWVYYVFFGGLVVFFTYFYTALVFNPIDLADNLRKNGGFIPGVRPGKATVNYIESVMNRITLPGAVFIALIAIAPTMLFRVTGVTILETFGGTSILIMVGVALETMTQLESQLKMRHYDGFFK